MYIQPGDLVRVEPYDYVWSSDRVWSLNALKIDGKWTSSDGMVGLVITCGEGYEVDVHGILVDDGFVLWKCPGPHRRIGCVK